MKNDIHPKYYPKAKFTCACGAKYEFGSTKEEVQVEICGSCHPFYTGKQNLIDTAGRVERFRARTSKAQTAPKTKKPRTKKKLLDEK